MWKKIAIAGAVGAAVLGSGAAALAATATTSTPSPNVATSGTTPTGTAAGTANGSTSGNGRNGGKAGKAGAKLALRLRKLEHGEWVSTTKAGDVTHDAVKGMVTAVSPTSITVKAADGFSATYVVNSTTKVRVKAGSGSISSVAVNDRVLASGTKTGTTLTAVHIVDAGAKK